MQVKYKKSEQTINCTKTNVSDTLTTHDTTEHQSAHQRHKRSNNTLIIIKICFLESYINFQYALGHWIIVSSSLRLTTFVLLAIM